MLLRIILVAALMGTSAIAADLPSSPTSYETDADRLTADELDQIRGSSFPIAGLSLIQSAANASTMTVGETMSNTGEIMRELTDNWTLNVAVPLIAAATSASR